MGNIVLFSTQSIQQCKTLCLERNLVQFLHVEVHVIMNGHDHANVERIKYGLATISTILRTAWNHFSILKRLCYWVTQQIINLLCRILGSAEMPILFSNSKNSLARIRLWCQIMQCGWINNKKRQSDPIRIHVQTNTWDKRDQKDK